MVCERAGVSTYTLADLPGLYDFRMAVRNERRLELALRTSVGLIFFVGVSLLRQ